MGDVEDADYDSGLSGEQTELAPSESGTEAHTAWALDDGHDDYQDGRRFSPAQVTAMAVAAAVILAAGAGVVAWQHMDREPEATAPTERGWGGPAINRPIVQLPPPPPSTVTVTATTARTVPVAVPAAPEAPTDPAERERALRRYDARFVDRLRTSGWVILDAPLLAQTGRQVCQEFAIGTSLAEVHVKLAPAYSAHDAAQFASLAQIVYPDCTAPY